MNIVKTGSKIKVYSNAVETMKYLPAKTYKLCYSQFEGFFLTEKEDMDIKESRIYGKQEEYKNIVFDMFKNTNRNLGVLVSGSKGTGKTLFMKMICQQGIKQNIPVIIIDQGYEDIIDFLDTIENDCIIVFDEFEKTYSVEGQNNLLGLFDGMSKHKKMFILTVNSTYNNKLSPFLLDRPGRIHYHLSFDFPTEEEITSYLKDNIAEKYWDQINKVVNFTRENPLNYDCLRAIVKELNLGRDFDYSIELLNIEKSCRSSYVITAEFDDGGIYTSDACFIPFSSKKVEFEIHDYDYNRVGKVKFCGKDGLFEPSIGSFRVPVEKVQVTPRYYEKPNWRNDNGERISKEEFERKAKELSIKFAEENCYPTIFDTKLVSLTYSIER